MLEVAIVIGIGIVRFVIIGHLDLLGEIRKMPFGLLVVLIVSSCSSQAEWDIPTRRMTSIPAPGRRPGLSLTG